MGVSSVHCHRESHEKTIVFKIENFTEFLKLSNEELEENGAIFEAGSCTLTDGTETPAIWKYFFEHTTNCNDNREGNWFGGFLSLHRPTNKSNLKSASVSCSVSLSSAIFPFKSFNEQRSEFTGPSGIGRANNALITEFELRQKTRDTNTLKVTLVIKVFSDHSYDPVLKIPPAIPAVQLEGQIQMNSDLVKMLESGDWADVKIRVPNEDGEGGATAYTKKAHKIFLTARSPVFAKMFAKDSTMIEAKTGEVVIKDLTPKGLNIFLHYLYTGEVLQDWIHVGPEILNAAEKYDCGQLKQYLGSNIMDAVSISNAMELYKLANLHGLTDAAETVADFISKNTKAVLDANK